MKYILLLVAGFLPGLTAAQNHPNELGVNVTSLIEQLFNFSESDIFQPFSPKYSVTYKRHFKQFSLRAGIGGSTYYRRNYIHSLDRTVEDKGTFLDYRIGIERQTELGKRWNFYYGLDAKHQIANRESEVDRINSGGWTVGFDNNEYLLGLSPLVGIEWRINDRVSLQTEANFIAYLTRNTQQPVVKPFVLSPSGTMPSTDKIKEKGSGTAFNIPDFIVLTVRL